MLHQHTNGSARSKSSPRARRRRDTETSGQRHTHILVPTGLATHDRPALLLGAEMAALHHAKLTVLQVESGTDRESSLHWLDAIDQLHRAKARSGGPVAPGGADASERARARIRQYVDRELPEQLRSNLEVCVEYCRGDLAETVARFAEQAATDLVILSSGSSRWWLPVLPAPVRRVMQLTRQQVIVVYPDAREGKQAA